MAVWRKDPADRRWFKFDWSPWLEDGESVTSFSVGIEDGITIADSRLIGNSVLVKLAGGTLHSMYTLRCDITTSSDNEYPTTKAIFIRTRQS